MLLLEGLGASEENRVCPPALGTADPPSSTKPPRCYLAVHEHAEGQGDAELRVLGAAAHTAGSVR